MAGTSKSGVEFVGDDQAMADLRKYADQVGVDFTKALEGFTADIAERTAGDVPHLTGTLASTLFSEVDSDGGTVGYDGSAPYDGWIEFGGTRGRDYVPEGRYLFPTATTAGEDYGRLAEESADETAERFPWSRARS